MAYTVILDNRGNPDFGQSPGRRLPGTQGGRKKVKDFEAASKACRAYIEENDLGGGNWTGGSVLDAAGNEVARVSYNGKVWPPGEFTRDMEPLWPKPSKEEKPKDPYEWERAVVETRFGPIEITGCFRVGNVQSVPRKFEIDGKGYDFMTGAYFDENGFRDIPGDFRLLAPGTYNSVARPSRAFVKELNEIVRDWASEPANMAMILRNEVKDRQQTIIHSEGVVQSYQRQIDAKLEEISADREAIARFEGMLADLEVGSPSP